MTGQAGMPAPRVWHCGFAAFRGHPRKVSFLALGSIITHGFWGVSVRLVPAPVFKTGEGFGSKSLVGSIPMHSRQAVSRMAAGKSWRLA